MCAGFGRSVTPVRGVGADEPVARLAGGPAAGPGTAGAAGALPVPPSGPSVSPDARGSAS